MDDIEAALEARPTPQTMALARVIDNLAPLTETVRATLSDPAFTVRFDEATPAQRAEIARLRRTLMDLAAPLQVRIRALDDAVKIAAARSGAKQFPLEHGRVSITPPQNDWVVETQSLRDALVECIEDGAITMAEINNALQPYTAYKADNRLLNYLRDNRGDKVRAAIEKHRYKPEIQPGRMKVSWPD